MKHYNVTIQATITKTLRVEAENKEDATELAHEEFSVLNDGNVIESYDQHRLDIEEVEQEEGAA